MKSRHKGIGQACGGGQHTNATMVGAWALAGLLCSHRTTENLCLGFKAWESTFASQPRTGNSNEFSKTECKRTRRAPLHLRLK